MKSKLYKLTGNKKHRVEALMSRLDNSSANIDWVRPFYGKDAVQYVLDQGLAFVKRVVFSRNCSKTTLYATKKNNPTKKFEFHIQNEKKV